MGFPQTDGELGLCRITPEVAREIEIALHGVLGHVLGDLLVEKKPASLLQTVVAELALSPAQEDENGALEEAVEINHQIVGPVAKGVQKARDLPEDSPAVPAFLQVSNPAFAPGDEDPVEHGVIHEQIRGGLLDNPGDVRLRVAAAKGCQRRQRVDHVPDGAEFDDEDVHPCRSLMIHCTASRMSSAM